MSAAPPHLSGGKTRIPNATYRLQFNRLFTLPQASAILDYLDSLGISDCYSSPLFKAGPESTHGYDVCSYEEINPQIGTAKDWAEFTARRAELGLGLLLDIVPNHMGAASGNGWWSDVLEKGPASKYADFFDIQWQPPVPSLRNKILLPVLEDRYGKVLEAGKLRLVREQGKFLVAYYDRRFPVAPGTLPACPESARDQMLEDYNGIPGHRRSFDRLDALLRQQHYRLAWWKVANEEINYRRFFDVAELVSLRMERREVFESTHQYLFSLLKAGKVTGLRVDHPDGLRNPREYFERLRAHPGYIVVEKILAADEAIPPDWPVAGTTGYDFLNRLNGLFVNDGNIDAWDRVYRDFTGCNTDFENLARQSKRQIINASFAGDLEALSRRLQEVASGTRVGRDFTLAQLRAGMAEWLANFPVYRTYLSPGLPAPSASDRASIQQAAAAARIQLKERDPEVIDFIEQLLLGELNGEFEGADLELVQEFVLRFQQLSGPVMAKGVEDTAFYRFNRLISANEVGGSPGCPAVSPSRFHAANSATASRWPHTLLATATHDTKRGEDVRARINVLSEMPREWGDAVARWSAWNEEKKTVVGGQPAPSANDEYFLYQTLIGAWPADADPGEGMRKFRERIAAAMLKAVREAKSRTNWREPHPAYENAVRRFIEEILANHASNSFLEDMRRFHRRIAFFGCFNSLSQTLLKMTSPGVPDFYQGTELWDLNLVDPDNRRPVDYGLRREYLAELRQKFRENVPASEFQENLAGLLDERETGRVKLYLIWRTLTFRKGRQTLFRNGSYVPLAVSGQQQNHVCAFARRFGSDMVFIVAPRLFFGLLSGREVLPLGTGIWHDTTLHLPRPSCSVFLNVLTNERLAAAEEKGQPFLHLGSILNRFPVALLQALP